MTNQLFFEVYRQSPVGFRGYIKLVNDVTIFKRWETPEQIPFPAELISFTDADIIEGRKREIKCDGNRFKKIRLETLSQEDKPSPYQNEF